MQIGLHINVVVVVVVVDGSLVPFMRFG